ncbi:ElyC/SanA/YdcF family protein [Clostridium sp. AL.422]|uniref:SanA/YdcF family protein n=1 Tax=Clostridium TaxID=1485 RepID=UPI00293DB6CD|nr:MULTISPECIES: ElyC/SanA/YdcF family protein [unclassified Clostridium]MDV4152352.1 ElyC/SanA/YdcF family protein [Clostridium sp. AL.422]
MRKIKLKKWGKRVMGICISLLIIFVLTISITISIVNSYKKYIYNIDDIPSDNDAIIVLGAGVRSDGSPSDILADRLETSLEVFNAGLGNTFILSGDHGTVEYNEVRAMKDYIMNENIDEKIVFMDHAGFSTYDTMYRAKEIFKVDKAIIVTNEYHLPRALYIARKLGIEAYGVRSDLREYQLMDSYKKREILAQLKDFAYVNILKPEPKFLGEAIPVNSSDGRVTEDEKNE